MSSVLTRIVRSLNKERHIHLWSWSGEMGWGATYKGNAPDKAAGHTIIAHGRIERCLFCPDIRIVPDVPKDMGPVMLEPKPIAENISEAMDESESGLRKTGRAAVSDSVHSISSS